ncbi:MAG: dihydrofolate reductase [Candidatus Omnitrophica bacterium]|nr:dihydrofolate reductase [Candidatus Omnitrophota bacterium]
MIISLVVAVSQNGVIGKNNRLPWKLPADLKRFKQLTMNHPILMGRKTFESIGKPLPGRTNIVITHQKDFACCGCLTASSIEKGLQLCENADEVFVIGGASIYEQSLPLADRIYLTRIHQDFEGDTRLFNLDKSAWQEIFREDFKSDTGNKYPYSFVTLKKK